MSSESGDTKEIEDKPESPDNVNTNAEPMVVDGTTNGNEGVEVADDELPQEGSKSEQQKTEQKGKTEDEATDETQKADEEELADTQELTEPVDHQKTEEEESTRKSDEDIDFEDNSDGLDTFYPSADSDSEKELEPLREGMGITKSKDKTKPGKRSGAASYQDSSSDEYEEAWSKPWRSSTERTRNPRKPVFTRRWSQKDTEDYRKGYPGKKDVSGTLNLDFYRNCITSQPNGDKIDDIHENWYGKYDILESHHGYIQWLFPIRENGMNLYAQELRVKEAEEIKKDPKTYERVLTSYKMMLNFYGMKLKDNTGELERNPNWRQRYSHLNRSMHNYLRITRILKSLGELGYEHLKAPFVRFILKEAMEQKTLENTLDSCYNYWIETIKDDKTREELRDFADNLICSD
ncbi:opioid growth factor receptor-like protein 1 [Haliotis cracherodii]|uniref:opioid growth factor receptor-like protein 1 n=1 Tax=Haliotis cracherodii TaxID=6455 RepID=UPI0039E957C2